MGEKLIIFIDFDGTISQEDVCNKMAARYAGRDWEEINRLWEEGVITTGECASRILSSMEVGAAELEVFFQYQEVDPGFSPFLDWVQKNQHLPIILSDGYDRYIKSILRGQGWEIEFYANKLYWDDGWRVESPYLDEVCPQCGVCKSKIIRERSLPGYLTVYIGDGYSDFCPAASCDIVFAKNELAGYCRKEGLTYYPYRDFHDILQQLPGIVRKKV